MSCRFSGSFGSIEPSAAEFDSLACAACFYFIYMVVPPHRELYQSQRCANGLLICRDEADPSCHCDNPNAVFNLPEYALNSSAITSLSRLQIEPPLPESFLYLTRQCCEAARSCCRETLIPESKDTQTSCPATWDGWQCFKSSSARQIHSSCPPYIYGDMTRTIVGQPARRTCDERGWGTAPTGFGEWTDYSGCLVQQEAHYKLLAGIAAFSISLLSLIPAVLLLVMLRPMRKQRMFVMHRHLMLSYLLYDLVYLFNCFVFVVDGAPGTLLFFTNHLSCRLLFTVNLRFLRLCTFSWMLAEGIYLFRLLRSSFSEGETLLPYKICCWGIPALLSVFYGILRQLYDNEGCWLSPSVHQAIEFLVMIPCVSAIAANFLLLLFLMQTIFKKMRDDTNKEQNQYKKAVKAALILFPLLGIFYLITIVRWSHLVYQLITLVLDGLQGCFVAVANCYMNKSVHDALRLWWAGQRESRAVRRECKTRMSMQNDMLQPLSQNA